jgi:ketosteroid isomerase-like protein
MTDDPPSAFVVADRLFAAIESGDIDAVAALYARDITVWHNTDDVEQSRAENLRTLAWLVDHTSSRSYTEVRRTSIPGGFVQQHVLNLELRSGQRAAIAACIVAQVDHGTVTRLNEYLDSAAVRSAFGIAG